MLESKLVVITTILFGTATRCWKNDCNLTLFYFPIQNPEMSSKVNVYWGIVQRGFTGDILETYNPHVLLVPVGCNSF
jgi:hypothetical protein